MRNKIIILMALIITASCDAPRDRRAAYKEDTSDSGPYWFSPSSSSGGQTSSDSSSDSSSDTSTDRTDTTSDTTSSDSNIPEEIKHCSWSTDGTSGFSTTDKPHLGDHTLCQSKSNPNDIYIQVKTTIPDSQVCFIPTYNSSSASVYIGGPRCIMINETKKIYKITLNKNRTGYSGYAINSVMVMKDKAYFYDSPFNQLVLAPDAYIYCSQFLDQYGHPGYCESFKRRNEYVFKKF